MERIGMLIRRMLVQLTADRRKFGLLCALAAVGLLFWARIIVIKNLPRTVMADPEQSEMAENDDSASGTESDNNPFQVRSIQLDLVPERDPFQINVAYFPGEQKPASESGDGHKSAPSTSEDPEQAISRLHLEAVIQGNPMAVISGRTYRPGDWIDTDGPNPIRFALVEVKRRSVLLEHEGRQYELRLDGSRG